MPPPARRTSARPPGRTRTAASARATGPGHAAAHRPAPPAAPAAPWPGRPTLDAWFHARGWLPFDFQQQVWQAMGEGRSGLLHATTGAGKTLAAGFGAWLRARTLAAEAETAPAAGARRPRGRALRDAVPAAVAPVATATATTTATATSTATAADAPGHATTPAERAPPLQVLWITPMRALAADTARALGEALATVAPEWRLGLRSGDTPAAERARQDRRLPTLLVTTPESLSLLLTRADARERLRGVHTVVVDEWHEQVGNKRGVQLQLALARLRTFRDGDAPVVWGLSATLGNLEAARDMLLGPDAAGRTPAPALVRGRIDKDLLVDTLLPAQPGRFAWGGHLGAQMRDPVAAEIAATADHPDARQRGSTLVFTNVRSQAEAWYQMLLDARPDWAGRIALHHGSLDKSVRDWVEAGLKDGSLIAVVATSSLDLGVDFVPVARVLQIGSAKGVARLLQRAGRSGHQPGRRSRITLVPTNTLELIEAVAARRAIAAGRVEPRTAPEQPLDVLVQHLVTVALGGGFEADALYTEVRGCWSYRALSRTDFDWALAFVERGGDSLGAYPEYHRVARGADGVWRVTDRGIALRHRLQVGTIVGDSALAVRWWHQAAGGGGSLGQIEEGFVARLKAGDCFVFAGRLLEYVCTRDQAAWVRRATARRGIVPSWGGSRMPLSTELADATRAVLDALPADEAPEFDGLLHADAEPELRAARPMLQAQARLSHLPRPGRLLVERLRSREGHHLFFYPYAGRLVHLGLASLLAWRLARARPATWSISVNDYGFELLSATEPDLQALHDGSLLADAGDAAGGAGEAAAGDADDPLLHEVLASLNSGELARKRFREIARVAGLVFAGYPGAPKSTRQLQASSSLFYDVFRQYDPANRLLGQAEGEVLAQELDLQRLRAALHQLQGLTPDLVSLSTPGPFALALMVERFREQLSTEQLGDRLQRLLAEAAQVMDDPPPELPADLGDKGGGLERPSSGGRASAPRSRRKRRI